MLQRGIGITVGALVSLILLVIAVPDNPGWADFTWPLIIGGVAAFFWPIVIGIWLGRRAKQRRDDQVSAEVQRQLDQQGKG
jgi:hypothetical protein